MRPPRPVMRNSFSHLIWWFAYNSIYLQAWRLADADLAAWQLEKSIPKILDVKCPKFTSFRTCVCLFKRRTVPITRLALNVNRVTRRALKNDPQRCVTSITITTLNWRNCTFNTPVASSIIYVCVLFISRVVQSEDKYRSALHSQMHTSMTCFKQHE